MDLHFPAPSSSASVSNDGGYALSDEPASRPAPAGTGAGAGAAVEVLAPVAAVTTTAPAEAAVPPQTAPEAAPAPAPAPAGVEPGGRRPVALRRKRRRASVRQLAPAWLVSLVVHVGVLAMLAAFTFRVEVTKMITHINSALVPAGAEREETPLYADPSALGRTDQAVGSETAAAGGGGGGGGGGFGGIGTGPPSATPAVRGTGTGDGEGIGAPGVKIEGHLPAMGLLPQAPGLDLGGGGLIAGDVAYQTDGIGPSLDQIANEILRHVAQHRLTVVWMFDESESMKDDQKAIRQKFDRIVKDLKDHADPEKKIAEPLTHAIVGFGKDLHYEQERPTSDPDRIGHAIERLKVDSSGVENTLHAIGEVIDHYSGLIRRDRRMVIVLVTDESGDDSAFVEEARQAVVERKVPVYVVGRQALFGYGTAHLRYIDPVTKDEYWPEIRRGPETADIECLQWDGLHERREEQPSGFAPYELGRLAKDTGGIYFLLPSEEGLRVRQREKAYRSADLKEYMPEYTSRAAYVAARQKSPLRHTLYQVITQTREFGYPTHFPVDVAQMTARAAEAGSVASERLDVLIQIQKVLEGLKKAREREPEKRWQAHYDLILAQVVAYQIKSFEYRACLEEMVKNPPTPKNLPSPDRVVEWVIDHDTNRRASKDRTEKKSQEAQKLLQNVIDRHPKTPWADLARDELGRGFGVKRIEWTHNPQYGERARLVPKY